jgi:hypothetical protein
MTRLKECVRRFREVPASQWFEEAGNWVVAMPYSREGPDVSEEAINRGLLAACFLIPFSPEDRKSMFLLNVSHFLNSKELQQGRKFNAMAL